MEIIRYESPCGALRLGAHGGKIFLCDWESGKHSLPECMAPTASEPILVEAVGQLDEYFAGKRKRFELPLETEGSEFQRKIWTELLAIPFGSTVSYSELAVRMGCGKAVRAVANAVGANRMSILIPCHRVIGKDGRLTGYAGGLEAKKFLLELEQSAILLLGDEGDCLTTGG